ncbi:hypothetical protein PVAP13_8NG272201 [Panicum virgatum]|uniref:Uncharacterized protein n=1 Tax=Panicum virgatum TaxID=38727 RepID=A0A8T0PH64_PANVG|nr:hypothetical protein PVAP13_8NG272201 [Panicum virgatum]
MTVCPSVRSSRLGDRAHAQAASRRHRCDGAKGQDKYNALHGYGLQWPSPGMVPSSCSFLPAKWSYWPMAGKRSCSPAAAVDAPLPTIVCGVQ